MIDIPETDEERRELVGHVARQLAALLEVAKQGDLDTAAGSRVLGGAVAGGALPAIGRSTWRLIERPQFGQK